MSSDEQQSSDLINESTVINTGQYESRRRGIYRKIPLCVLLVFFVIILASAAILMIKYPSSPQHPKETAGSGDALLGERLDNTDIIDTKVSKGPHCIYHTSESLIKKLPDNLEGHCKPVKVPSDSTKLGWFKCPNVGNFTNMYIKMHCLCDSKTQCMDERDRYNKHNCSICRDEKHCPCQNGGQCNNCPRGQTTGADITCRCLNGTFGRYCTKITQRVCMKMTNIDLDVRGCNETNDHKCVTDEYFNTRLLCEWTEQSARTNLSKLTSCLQLQQQGYSGFLEDKEMMINKQEENKDNATPYIWAIIVVSAAGILVVLALVFYLTLFGTRRTVQRQDMELT